MQIRKIELVRAVKTDPVVVDLYLYNPQNGSTWQCQYANHYLML